MAAPRLGRSVMLLLAAGLGASCGADDVSCPAGTRPVGSGCQPIDDCAGGPCVHGTCVDRNDGFACECPPGFTGATCADDVDECAAGADDCAVDARCTNTDGGFTCTCPIGTAGDGRACTPCPAGQWGDGCGQACELGHCVGAVTCDPVDGSGRSCTACAPGFTGPACEGSCEPTGCRDGAVTCDQGGGARMCTDGCVDGRWGPACEATCAAGSCAGTASCDQATGALTACAGCSAGSWGPTCGTACPQGACIGAVTCEQATGAPIACATCAPGTWGPSCAAACAQGSCTGVVTCDQSSGAPGACGGCAAGRWGPTCQDVCPQAACVGAVTCDQSSGAAITCEDCAAGTWGPTCVNACAQGDCVGVVVCDRASGQATACGDCAAGAWGPTCTEACAQGDCVGAVTCDQGSGVVDPCAACTAGAWGPTCTEACAQGACVGAVTCDQGSGTPTSCPACTAGWWGPTCAEACAQGHCIGTVLCDQGAGTTTLCSACTAGWFGGTCDSDWWDLAWAWRTPIAFDTSAAPPGVDHVQVPFDVDALCYGTPLPPLLYSYQFEQFGLQHLDSLDGHGGFATLDHGTAFAPHGDDWGVHFADELAEWIDLPDVVPSTHTVTVTAWIKVDVPSPRDIGVLQAWGTAGVPGGEVYMLSVVPAAQCQPAAAPGVHFMAKVHPVGYPEHNACSTTTIEPGHIYFVAMSYDRRYERLWINGALERRHDYGAGFGALEPSSAVRLGVERSLSGFFHGVVDDVTVFDGIVDDTDVAALIAPGCRRDLADLRFHDVTTDTLLPYWIESATRVWIRVPVDASSHMIAAYHGNPLAMPGADGAATFELFDDFADGIDPLAWTMVGAGCTPANPPVAVAGKVRATGPCEGLESVATFGARRLSAAVDVQRAGPSHQACADVRLGWSTANVGGAVRFDTGNLDALGVGAGPATCAGAASVPGPTFDLGTLELLQTPTADDWLARYQPLHGAGVAAARVGEPGPKGALQLGLAGHADTPRYLDNLRVWVPSTTTVDVGLPCAPDGTCAEYRWVNLGARSEPIEIAPSCTALEDRSAPCELANLGRRVHVDNSPGSPRITLRPVDAGSSTHGVTVPGGAGSVASLSPDQRTLTWSGRTSCSGHTTELVALQQVWECQRAR